ncbi:MAG: DinB family protein [Gemmatimonadetes bacterium]|nr:DinB family protein [Gemmatimonadota bacterium]
MSPEERPGRDEYADFYHTYISKVPDGSIVETLRRGIGDTVEMLGPVGPEAAAYRYEPGKWSLKEVLGHLIDTERVFAFRAMSFARGETQAFPGMEQDDYVATGNFDARDLPGLLRELKIGRDSTVAMLDGFPPEAWARRGTASGCEFSVRALAWIMAGHEIHHRQVLLERYLTR